MPVNQSAFIHQDASWLVVHKPCGLSSHAAHSGDLGLAEWLALHHDLQVYLCSRLDKETSGLILLALNREAAGRAQIIHEEGQGCKVYHFISDRDIGALTWTCSDPLDGKECITSFTRLRAANGYFLYQAVIRRGRRHQIRRHAAASGVAILGDVLYGGSPHARLCLHCSEVQWPEIVRPLRLDLPASFDLLLSGAMPRLIEMAVALERRLPLLASITDAMRLVQRSEVHGSPFSLDLYGDYLCLTGYDEDVASAQLLAELQEPLAFLEERLGCRGGVVRTNRRDPHRRRLFCDVECWGKAVPKLFSVQEHGLSFQVTLNDSQHVGLFLDQRDSRRRIWQQAKAKRLSNLFAFTCSFSAFAAQAGCEVVFSVDLAAGSLERGKANFQINGLDSSGRGKFIKEDVRKWLARQLRKKEAEPEAFPAWDIIICDPPVFASAGKGATFSVEKEWAGLARQARALLAPGGMALFANNHGSGDASKYRQDLQECFRQVTELRPPFDFPAQAGQPVHVRIYLCEK